MHIVNGIVNNHIFQVLFIIMIITNTIQMCQDFYKLRYASRIKINKAKTDVEIAKCKVEVKRYHNELKEEMIKQNQLKIRLIETNKEFQKVEDKIDNKTDL